MSSEASSDAWVKSRRSNGATPSRQPTTPESAFHPRENSKPGSETAKPQIHADGTPFINPRATASDWQRNFAALPGDFDPSDPASCAPANQPLRNLKNQDVKSPSSTVESPVCGVYDPTPPSMPFSDHAAESVHSAASYRDDGFGYHSFPKRSSPTFTNINTEANPRKSALPSFQDPLRRRPSTGRPQDWGDTSWEGMINQKTQQSVKATSDQIILDALNQRIQQQEAMLNHYRGRYLEEPLPSALSEKSTTSASGLKSQATVLRQRLASGDIAPGDIKKTIEIIKLIEGKSSGESVATTPTDKTSSVKSKSINISSNGHENPNTNAAMDLKMHDLTKTLTKMHAYNKFQRQQEDSDKLRRIEEQLAKTEDKPKESDRVTSFHKRTAREVEKLNRKLGELAVRDKIRSSDATQEEYQSLKARIDQLSTRCSTNENTIRNLTSTTPQSTTPEPVWQAIKSPALGPEQPTSVPTADNRGWGAATENGLRSGSSVWGNTHDYQVCERCYAPIGWGQCRCGDSRTAPTMKAGVCEELNGCEKCGWGYWTLTNPWCKDCGHNNLESSGNGWGNTNPPPSSFPLDRLYTDQIGRSYDSLGNYVIGTTPTACGWQSMSSRQREVFCDNCACRPCCCDKYSLNSYSIIDNESKTHGRCATVTSYVDEDCGSIQIVKKKTSSDGTTSRGRTAWSGLDGGPTTSEKQRWDGPEPVKHEKGWGHASATSSEVGEFERAAKDAGDGEWFWTERAVDAASDWNGF